MHKIKNSGLKIVSKQRQEDLKKAKEDKKTIVKIYCNNPHVTLVQLGQMVNRSHCFASKAISQYLSSIKKQ